MTSAIIEQIPIPATNLRNSIFSVKFLVYHANAPQTAQVSNSKYQPGGICLGQATTLLRCWNPKNCFGLGTIVLSGLKPSKVWSSAYDLRNASGEVD